MPGWPRSARSRSSWRPRAAPPAGITVGDCVELLEIAAAVRTGEDRHPQQPVLLPAAACLGRVRPGRAGGDAGVLRPREADVRAADRPLPHPCQPVRDVLVDYLRERQPSSDFSSLQHLAYLLGKLFWADLEAHHPGIGSLKLPRDVAAAWKQRVMTRTKTAAATATAPRQ